MLQFIPRHVEQPIKNGFYCPFISAWRMAPGIADYLGTVFAAAPLVCHDYDIFGPEDFVNTLQKRY